jgi:hypothetical protein
MSIRMAKAVGPIRRSSATGPTALPAVPPATSVICRSFLCARTVDATERVGQKIILQCQLPDLRLHVLDAWTRRLAPLRRGEEHRQSASQQLRLPLRDLVGMYIKLLGQLGQRLPAF